MDLSEVFQDKSRKPKEKTEALAHWLLEDPEGVHELLAFAATAKEAVKATCIEALEFATKTNPSVANLESLRFVTLSLTDKAPRVKWESAKVIGNIAPLYKDHLEEAVVNLLTNSEHEGTVVRWSAAFALGEILTLKTKGFGELYAALETICAREEKESIKKIYRKAIKKATTGN